MMKVLALLLILAGAVSAQQNVTITGRVLVNGSGGPGVNRSHVTLTSMSEPTIEESKDTDPDGNFSFANVRPGSYRITANGGASAVSLFAEKHISVVGGRNSPVELIVTNNVRIRETVTVAADSSQTIEQVSKTVDVIGGQEMRDRADFALVDTLRTVPGFRVQQLGGFGRTATIKTRGLRNQDTAILIDGIRFRDVSSITGDASAFLSDFTLTNVSKIEVLRGSGSSLYGTNAIGGVVDFQTPQPSEKLHGQVSAALGGLGLKRLRGNLSDSFAGGKFGFTLGISRTLYTEGIDKDDDADNTNFQNRLEFQPAQNTHLSARFFVSNAFVRLNADPDTLNAPQSNSGVIRAEPGVNFVFDADDPDSVQKSNFFNGQFVLTHAFNNKILFEGSYSGLRTSRKNNNGILGPGFQSASTSVFDGTTHTANAHINWVPNAFNQLTAGYEFEHEKFGNDGITPTGVGNFFTRAYQSSHTFYIQDMVQLFDRRLQIAGGFRTQFFDLGSPRFSLTNAPYSGTMLSDPPRAYTFDGSAAYSFSKGTKLRAHIGNGYRVPSLYERFGTFFNTFTFPDPNRFEALGDPDLKPEQTIAFDSGIEQYLFKDRAKVSATYFYTKLLDTIGFGNTVRDIGTTTRPFGGYLNTKGGIARGAEFSAKIRPASTSDIFVSYTYTNSDQRVQQVAGSGVTRTLGIPSQQFTVVATQRVGRFWANFDFLATNGYLAPVFSSETFNSYVFRFRGNRRADFTAGYTVPLTKDRFDLRLFGTIENAFDHDYYENGFRTPGRNARIGLAFGF